MRPFRHTFTRAWPRRSMWLRATSPTKASSTRLALRCISRPARNTARTLLKMVASYSSSGLNEPRKRLPISATSSSPKRQLNGIAHEPHDLAGYDASDFVVDARRTFTCRASVAGVAASYWQHVNLPDEQMSSSCSSAAVGVGALFGSHSSKKALARASALGTFVSSEQVAVQRGLAEFRGGRPVLFSAREPFVAMPIDGCDQQLLEAFQQTFNTAPLRLAITARRASALGMKTRGPVTLHLDEEAGVNEIFSLAASSSVTRPPDASPARPTVLAGIDLAKLAGRLPAVLIADAGSAISCALVQLEATAVSVFREQLIRSLSIAASSVIPLEDLDAAQFVVFRDAIGSELAAIVIGEPNLSNPVLVRIHSACLTGDVFGSRRCDCGDQLKLAISRMRSTGGILLYLDQEGRGLGLRHDRRKHDTRV